MTQSDYDAFSAEYRRLSAALERYKQSPQELATKTDAYFHVLKAFPLHEVIAKADQWLKRETTFPKPAQWAGVMVFRAADVPVMSDDEARIYRRAESLKWEDEPCACRVCVDAGVDWKPIRFVPETDADDRDRQVRDPLRERIVTAGHWAHGHELQRYYVAKGQFYQRAGELGHKNVAALVAQAGD